MFSWAPSEHVLACLSASISFGLNRSRLMCGRMFFFVSTRVFFVTELVDSFGLRQRALCLHFMIGVMAHRRETYTVEGIKTATAQKKLSLAEQARGDKASDEVVAKKSKVEAASTPPI